MTPGTGLEVDLDIEGMTCASCANRIERKLNTMPGVHASVNYATEVARVQLPEGVSVDDAIATIQQTGYRAKPPSANESADRTAPLVRRAIVSSALAAPVTALTMIPALQFPAWQWVALALTLPIVTWGALPFHKAAITSALHRTTTMDTLVSIGVTAATLWSVWAMVFGSAGHIGMRMRMRWLGGGHDELYLEVAAVVTAFLLIGRLIEARAKRSNTSALRSLARLGAKAATLVEDGTERRIPIEQLRVGQHFRVLPGEKIAADGVVTEGASAIDASLITGESVPAEVAAGDAVTGGTINGTGMLTVRATRVGSDTELAGIARMLEHAQTGKADVQRIADRVSAVFVPAVLVLAVLTLAGWMLATGDLSRALAAAIATLIIACPCALGLATPTALLVGTTRGSQLGILIRDAAVLERARGITTVIVDKTGTVTEGNMRVAAVTAASSHAPREALAFAAALERGSEHPIARAIVREAPDAPRATGIKAHPGKGVSGVIDGIPVRVGTAAWLREEWSLDLEPALRDALEEAQSRGATAVVVAAERVAIGVVAVTDSVRATSAKAVERLLRLGVEAEMVTGDNDRAARHVAGEVGITRVVSEASPATKVERVRALQAAGKRVAMVGDGVNDAAALASADLGMAMGGGTDVARDAADITLMRGDLAAAADAIALSRATLRTIKQNLFWAFAYNTLAIPLAVAGLLTPLIAGVAMVFSSLFVVANALRLRRFRALA